MSMMPMPSIGPSIYPGTMMIPGGYMAPASVQASEIGEPVGAPLSNGARGFFQEARHKSRSQVSILLPIGATMSGTRELLPGLLLQGSQATKAFITQCHARGIYFAPMLTGDKLQLNVSAPAGQEAEMVQAAMELLTRPQVDPQAFNNLKEDLIKNLQNMLSDPEVPLGEAVIKALYGPNHPYAIGTRETIDHLMQQTPNSILGAYFQALQRPQDAIVMVVSSQPVAYQQALISQGIQQFGWYGNPYRHNMLPMTPKVPHMRGFKGPLLVPNETLDQARLLVAWRAPLVNDPDYPAFLVLRELLEDMSGRFFKVLRTEKGLVYGTSQGYSNDQKQGAGYSLSAQVDFDKIGQALQGIQKVTQSVIQAPVNQTELQMAKKKFLLQMRGAMQSAEGIASLSGAQLQNDLSPIHPDVLKSAIERVGPVDIQRIANRVFNIDNGYQILGIAAPRQVLAQWTPRSK